MQETSLWNMRSSTSFLSLGTVVDPQAISERLTFGDAQLYYDIITADPCGIGLNYPVTCDPLGNETFSYFPRTSEEYEQTLSKFEALGRSCLDQTGDVMQYMDTLTQARDLEAVRLAIDEGPLNYCSLMRSLS